MRHDTQIISDLLEEAMALERKLRPNDISSTAKLLRKAMEEIKSLCAKVNNLSINLEIQEEANMQIQKELLKYRREYKEM